jgi:hypothetical protein
VFFSESLARLRLITPNAKTSNAFQNAFQKRVCFFVKKKQKKDEAEDPSLQTQKKDNECLIFYWSFDCIYETVWI